MIEGFREPPMISLIIREVRKAGKITQEVIAKHLGMTRSNYSKKETRIIEFTFNEVFHILDLLDHHLSSDIMKDLRYRIYGINVDNRKGGEWEMSKYKGIYQELSYRIVGKIGDADIQLIYRIIEKSDPEGFESAVLNCCDMDEIEDRIKEAKKDRQNFHRWIVCNYIEDFIYNWIIDIFGAGLSEYFSNLHRGEYKDDIDNYKAGLVYKVFQDLNTDDKIINNINLLSIIKEHVDKL